ncbi:MAG: hypothetical protein U1E65_22085 [Myxococcota bacterium]
MVGTFEDRTGSWSLLSESSAFTVMAPNVGKGDLTMPSIPGLADLVLQLDAPGSMPPAPSDDVFSLPIRIMQNGGAAASLVKKGTSYHGVACPGMSEIPDCNADILCLSAEDSLLYFPPGSGDHARKFQFSGNANSKAEGPLLAICGEVPVVHVDIMDSMGTVFDSAEFTK